MYHPLFLSNFGKSPKGAKKGIRKKKKKTTATIEFDAAIRAGCMTEARGRGFD